MMIDVSKTINAKFTPIIQDEEPEEWLKLRTTGIGGSDAGAIMGLNKYASPLTVYLAKKNIKGFDGNNATEWGHILEDPIRRKAREELKADIIAVPGMYTSYDYPFMNANLDGIIYTDTSIELNGMAVAGIGGHEIKTSANGEGFTESEIPDAYYCQVQHYMAVTGLKWFILTVFILSKREGRHYIIPRNDEFISKLIETEKTFWYENVMQNVAPAPTGCDGENEYLKKLPLSESIELDEETESLIYQEKGLESKIKELEKNINAIKSQIILKLYEKSDSCSENTTAKAGKFKITYNTQVRKSIDTDAIKRAGLFEQYSKETKSKVLRISEMKEGK